MMHCTSSENSFPSATTFKWRLPEDRFSSEETGVIGFYQPSPRWPKPATYFTFPPRSPLSFKCALILSTTSYIFSTGTERSYLYALPALLSDSGHNSRICQSECIWALSWANTPSRMNEEDSKWSKRLVSFYGQINTHIPFKPSTRPHLRVMLCWASSCFY